MLTSLLDGRVFADRTGDGAPSVLALHGWGRSRTDLARAVQGTSALLLDLPGFGASPPPPEPWGTAEYAALLAPLLDDGEPRVLVGHSFGGRIAVQLAAARPDRVAGVVLTGVPLLRRATSNRPALRYRVGRALHRRGLLGDARMDRLRDRFGSADYRAATGVMRGTLVRTVAEDYADLLPRIPAPVQMVWGAHDTAAPVEMAERAQRLFPRAELVVSPTSAHLLDAALEDLLRERLQLLLAERADRR